MPRTPEDGKGDIGNFSMNMKITQPANYTWLSLYVMALTLCHGSHFMSNDVDVSSMS